MRSLLTLFTQWRDTSWRDQARPSISAVRLPALGMTDFGPPMFGSAWLVFGLSLGPGPSPGLGAREVGRFGGRRGPRRAVLLCFGACDSDVPILRGHVGADGVSSECL